jgi:hypothetical protein
MRALLLTKSKQKAFDLNGLGAVSQRGVEARAPRWHAKQKKEAMGAIASKYFI